MSFANCTMHEWNGHVEIFSRPQVIEISGQYLLLPGAPNDRFRGNICSEPSRMAKIFGSPKTAKNFENVSW